MSEEVVHALEVVDVDEAETEVAPAPLGLDQLALESLVEVTVISETGQRIGEREPHRAQGAIRRALVESDREQRSDERGREERRPLPEDDEHERRRRHQSEDDDRPAQAGVDQLEEGAPRRSCHHERDEDEVDAVLRRCRDRDLGDESVGAFPADSADEESSDGRGGGEDRAVVGDTNRRTVLEYLYEDWRSERDEHARGPAEEDDRASGEDERERDAAAIRPLDRDGIAAREGRRGEERRNAEQHGSVVTLSRESEGGNDHGAQPEQAHDGDDRR